MSSEPRRERVREVRRRLAREGPPWTRDQAGDFDAVTVPERDCDALRDLLIAEGVETIVEVGLAYGSSALAIGEALLSVGTGRPLHVVIDPHQATAWSNVGWRLLRSAGLDTIARLVLEPSSVALPQLVAEGLTADAAFVDGSHRFHEVFVDLYFLRKIVRPGGIVVLDDHWWPSVRAAGRYFEVNMGWRVVPGAFAGGTVDHRTGHPRLRALRLPDPAFEPAFERFQPF
jgi:predicted O-methyltransferase YrrM